MEKFKQKIELNYNVFKINNGINNNNNNVNNLN